MSKKLISLLLCVYMLLCLSACKTTDPNPVLENKSTKTQTETTQKTDKTETSGTAGLEYTLSADETYCIVSDYSGEETSVVIPSMYKGLPVKAIGKSAFFAAKITSVSIPDSITRIGEKAFWNCPNITEIHIPSSVTYIGERAFDMCTALGDITIPSSVTTIGVRAFQHCRAIKQITIPSSVKELGAQCFDGCESLTDIYCEVEMKPSGWAKGWDDGINSNGKVHWDCN